MERIAPSVAREVGHGCGAELKTMSREFSSMDVQSRIRNGIDLLNIHTPTLVCRTPEIWTFPSESRSDVTFAVTSHEIGGTDMYTCTCEDYRFHGGFLKCKHINAVLEHKQRLGDRISQVNIKLPPQPAGQNVTVNIEIGNSRYQRMGIR
jgi:hypothetical protein